MKSTLSLVAFAAISFGLHAQDNLDTVRITSQKVSENVYMLKGDGGNIGVLTGTDGIVVVDDQFAPLSQKIQKSIKSLDPGSVRLLINTHIHGDHTGGNENFKRLGATIVAHDRVRERMMVDQVSHDKTITPARDKDAWPVVTFSDKISFHLNGQDIDLLHFGNGHTDGDIVIHFKNANVIHAGDLYVRYGYPFIDVSRGGAINGFILNLEKIMSLMDDNSKVIPGHGELATKKDVKIFTDKIRDIRDQVAAALKKGKKPQEITSLGITDKYDAEWGKGFLKGKDFALMVAENLTSVPASQSKK